MPVVRAQQQVRTEALPGARRSASETALSTGAGLEEAKAQSSQAMGQFGEGIARFGATSYGNMIAQERQRADEVALLSASSQLSAWENQRIYDPNNGALTVKGKDALPLPEQVNTEFAKVAGDIEAGLSTPEQKAAFQRVKLQRGTQLDLTLRRHVFGEMQTYEAQELQSYLENSVSAAISNATDPRRVGEELDRATTAIKTHAPRLGMGPEQIEKQVTAVATATHEGVINRLLNTDNVTGARVYFEETKDQLKGDALVRVEKALEVGSQRKESQTEADKIIAGGGTITEQRAKARAIEDPEVRDQVMARVEHDFSIKEQADQDALRASMLSAYDTIDKTGGVTKIPAAQWAAFPGEVRSSMRSYAAQRAKGTPIETDLPSYYRLIQMAGDDPTAFVKENLLQYRAKLDDPEFKQLAGLQLSIKSGNTKASEKDLTGFRTRQAVLESTLPLYGLPTNPKPGTKEEAAIAQLNRMVDQRVETFQNLTGKQPQNADVQLMVDDILSTTKTEPTSWWNFWKSPAQKRLIDTTIADVPAQERKQIEESLRRAGRPISDATVLNLYIELNVRGKK